MEESVNLESSTTEIGFDTGVACRCCALYVDFSLKDIF